VRRAALPLLALAAVCAAGALPALAADQGVQVRGLQFSPSTVALKPGETLTIANGSGAAHSLRFTDEATARRDAEVGWTETRTFTAAEARDEPYEFYCRLHKLYGMRGFVYVNATGTVPAATPAPTTTPGPTATPGPSPSATPTPGPGGGPAPAPAPAAKLRSLKLGRAGRRGVSVAIDLSRASAVRGTLKRRAPGAERFRRVTRVRFGTVAAGPRTLKLKRRLKPGRYRLRLTAAGQTRTLRFRVRP
jgi:plastocyanin